MRPVVEAADPDEEAERRGHELDGDEHRALPDRVPVGEPADQDREREADAEEDRRHPQDAQPARARSAGGSRSPAGAVRVRGRVREPRRSRYFGSLARYCDELLSLSGGICVPKFVRHHVRDSPGAMYARRVDDRLVDERGERAAIRLRRLLLQVVEVRADLAGRAGRLARVAAAAAVLLEDGEPGRPAAACRRPSARRRTSAAVRMSTWLRISAWPRPQSSVQMTGNVPVRVGVTTSELYCARHRVLLLRELAAPRTSG